MHFQQNPLLSTLGSHRCLRVPAKPLSRDPRLPAWHNYSSQSFGASSILLFKAAGTVIYASKIAPCPRLGPFAHGTFPIRWATSGVDFVQPSSRSPRSPQSEITLWAAETYSTRGSARHIYSSVDPLFCRERATGCHDPLYPDVALASSLLTLLSKRSLNGRTRPLAPLPSRTRNCIRARSMSLVSSCVASEIRSPQP